MRFVCGNFDVFPKVMEVKDGCKVRQVCMAIPSKKAGSQAPRLNLDIYSMGLTA